MWTPSYKHAPEPFEKRTRILIVLFFLSSLLLSPLFPPLLLVSAISGRLLWCEFCGKAIYPDMYEEVGSQELSILKWFIIIISLVILALLAFIALNSSS